MRCRSTAGADLQIEGLFANKDRDDERREYRGGETENAERARTEAVDQQSADGRADDETPPLQMPKARAACPRLGHLLGEERGFDAKRAPITADTQEIEAAPPQEGTGRDSSGAEEGIPMPARCPRRSGLWPMVSRACPRADFRTGLRDPA